MNGIKKFDVDDIFNKKIIKVLKSTNFALPEIKLSRNTQDSDSK
jgi:DNA-binding transcriptional MerR regulator